MYESKGSSNGLTNMPSILQWYVVKPKRSFDGWPPLKLNPSADSCGQNDSQCRRHSRIAEAHASLHGKTGRGAAGQRRCEVNILDCIEKRGISVLSSMFLPVLSETGDKPATPPPPMTFKNCLKHSTFLSKTLPSFLSATYLASPRHARHTILQSKTQKTTLRDS